MVLPAWPFWARFSFSRRKASILAYRLSTCCCKLVRCDVIALNSSDSLKELAQQFGAYWHERFRLPQRWQGVWPLHFILRRLHSLLFSRCQPLPLLHPILFSSSHSSPPCLQLLRKVGKMRMEYIPSNTYIPIPFRSRLSSILTPAPSRLLSISRTLPFPTIPTYTVPLFSVAANRSFCAVVLSVPILRSSSSDPRSSLCPY